MSSRLILALAVTLAVMPVAASAQATVTEPAATRRELALERREALQARREARAARTPDERRAMRAERSARRAAMPPEQQEFMRAMRSYRTGLRVESRRLQADVAAGRATRDEMARALTAYRDTHRPARPAGMPSARPSR